MNEKKKKAALLARLTNDNDNLGGQSYDISHSIAQLPNHAMAKYTMQHGFIAVPRDLINHPTYRKLGIKQRHVIDSLYHLAAYRQQTVIVGPHSVTVQPGQLYYSYRYILNYINDGIHHKADHVTLNDVKRALDSALTSILIRKVIHNRLLITLLITHTYDTEKYVSDTPSDTKLIQKRYKYEEREERKETHKPRAFHHIDPNDSSNDNAQPNQAATDTHSQQAGQQHSQQTVDGRANRSLLSAKNLPWDDEFGAYPVERVIAMLEAARAAGARNVVAWAKVGLRKRYDLQDAVAEDVESNRAYAMGFDMARSPSGWGCVACNGHVELTHGSHCIVVQYDAAGFRSKFDEKLKAAGLLVG